MIKKYLFSIVLLYCISQAWGNESPFTISEEKVFLDDVEIIEDSDGAIYGLLAVLLLAETEKTEAAKLAAKMLDKYSE